MKRKTLLLLALLPALLFSCKPNEPDTPSEYTVGSGVLVLNEGNFQFSNASLSFYDIEADTVANNLFYKVNGVPLGDVAQSFCLLDGHLFVVVNNSNYIYKMDAQTLVCDTTKPFKLGDFYSPREMCVVAPNKAYVSDLMGTGLWIVDPQDMSHSGAIEMGKTTEKMLMVGNELYVSNWSNYYLPEMEKNTVQVVDVNNDVMVAEITVGKEPNTMAVDKDGHVWVLCEGATWEDDGENPSLWEIDPMLKTATKRCEFEGVAMCMKSDVYGRYLYFFLNGDVRRFDVETQSLSETFRIEAEGRNFYNMAVDARWGIFVTDAKNYMMNGTVYRYTDDGLLLGSFEAGIIPNAMLFK